MNGLFITGTDTDVGKTVVSALLLAELRRRGLNAAPMKPVQTGCDRKIEINGDAARKLSGFKTQGSFLTAPDLDYSLALAGMTVSQDDYEAMSPCRFEPACSPHLAAESAGTEIEIAQLVVAARALASRYELILAEGAGGILVPLNARETMLDLMHALGMPVLLAARPGLGTINHTLLSLRTLRSDGLNIAGVVFVAGTDAAPGFIEQDNVRMVEHFGRVPVLGTVPYCATLAETSPDAAALPEPVTAAVARIVDQLSFQR